ncbi:hypothetical protein [Paenisporosarcina indica]|uniref:hypothetical protein n=1 Tax=Paenisporosarcina indica TaxID=650093 RepID=UPI00094FF810|nr:hypothetical protein [Paenisporosarcina indica]
MRENIKRHLDESVPSHITLSEVQKRKILNEANKRIHGRNLPSTRMLKPIAIGVAIICLAGFLSFPYIQDWSEESAYQPLINEPLSESIKKVTITDVEYPSLINAVYVADTEEMIYTDHNGIYSYSVETETKRVLVEPKDNAEIYELAVSGEWLVWEDITTSKLYILNRISHELNEFSNSQMTSDFQLDGDTLTYMSIGDVNSFIGYKKLNLTTWEETEIHELTGEGASSRSAIHDGLLVIPEQFKTGNKNNVTLFIYNLTTQVQVGEYIVPYEFTYNVTLTDNKVFTMLYNEGEDSILAYIDLEDDKLHEVNVPISDAYAVYEDFVALSVPTHDSNTVKLFQIENNGVVELPTFSQIKERLVKPRFTEDGILVVNGEGKQLSMYLQDVELLR